MWLHERLILTDCDGVLLNWNSKFHEWMSGRGYTLIPRANEFYGIDIRYNISKDESRELIREFNNSSDIGFLTPYRDSLYYIDLLYRKHGYKFGVITSISSHPATKQLREKNLYDLFGRNVFEFVECLDTGADKHDALSQFQDTDCFWIEDSVENAEVGASLGLRSLLMEHTYNRNADISDVTLVKNWGQIYEIIIGQI